MGTPWQTVVLEMKKSAVVVAMRVNNAADMRMASIARMASRMLWWVLNEVVVWYNSCVVVPLSGADERLRCGYLHTQAT